MRWGALAIKSLAALLGFMSLVPSALAAPQASFEAGADGRVRLVGDGWRPGDQLAFTLGRDRFEAFVDSAGGFEVATGLASFKGPMAVRHLGRMEAMLPAAARPHPLALWLAQAFLTGAAYAGVLVLVAFGAHLVGRRRYAARHDSWPRGLARPARRR